ncbi:MULTISPECIES: hypothetical protein [Butyricimonas]|uniref:hypothetical protein n=1 Tax=Butyricimonas TaxID=574697 RepID=UPI0007FB429E|nr:MULTISPECIES: hypothetical protein [Butyricimonas]
MKHHLYIFLLLIACSDKSITINPSPPIGTALTQEEETVLNSIKEQLLFKASISRGKSNAAREFTNSKELNSLAISSIPYMTYNDSIFYSNPSPEALHKSLSLSKNKIWYVGTKEGKVALMCEAVKDGKHWRLTTDLNGITYFNKSLGWLLQKIETGEVKEIKLLDIYKLPHFMVCTEEKTTYYTFLGFKMSEEDFCNYLLACKVRYDEMQAFEARCRNNPDYLQQHLDSVNKANGLIPK